MTSISLALSIFALFIWLMQSENRAQLLDIIFLFPLFYYSIILLQFLSHEFIH